jgi:hypothetical protein
MMCFGQWDCSRRLDVPNQWPFTWSGYFLAEVVDWQSSKVKYSYISSRSWSDIAQVLYKSTPQPFDQLVRLRQSVFPNLDPCPSSVQLVVFKDMNDIPELLRSYSTNLQNHHRRRVEVWIGSHVKSGPSSRLVVGRTPATDKIESPGDISGGDGRAEGLAEYAAQDVDADDGEEPDRTKEAIIIQRAARRHFFKDAEGYASDTSTKGRHRVFKSCKVTAKAVHAKYRKLYLGPVPHLLLCVEWIATRAQDSKNAIKARRVKATMQEKSDLMAQHKKMR